MYIKTSNKIENVEHHTMVIKYIHQNVKYKNQLYGSCDQKRRFGRAKTAKVSIEKMKEKEQ